MTYEQRIRQELELVAGTEELVQVFYGPETDDYTIGTVLRVGSETLALQAYTTKYSRADGLRSISIEEITSVVRGGRYLRALQTLVGQPWESLRPAQLIPEGDGHLAVLRAAKEAGVVVSCVVEYDTYQGYVEEIGEDWAQISLLGEYDAGDDGTRIFDTDDIERVFVGGHDEMRLAFLARDRVLREQLG